VDTGSREENASKQELEPRSDSIGTEKALALQLHSSSEVSAASVALVSSPPKRPCENTVDRDAPLSELDSDATDFLDRPADQE
jgi:hypothetical protein